MEFVLQFNQDFTDLKANRPTLFGTKLYKMTTVWELAERIHRVSDIYPSNDEKKSSQEYFHGIVARWKVVVYLVVLGIHRLKSKFFT